MKSFPNVIRLINYNNQWHTTPIGGWTKEGGLVILEIKHLQKVNKYSIIIDINEPCMEHQSINILFNAWTLCRFNFKLYNKNIHCKCLKKFH